MISSGVDLLGKTRAFAESILTERLSDMYLFHNAEHTRYVVEAAKEISRHSDLNEKESETVLLAAWLHDIGYCEGKTGHEQRSMDMARKFLEENAVDSRQIADVLQCIDATRMPQHPQTLMAEVVCDADLYHLSDNSYAEKAELLRKEISHTIGEKLGKKKWLQINKVFYENHQYFTEYGKRVLEPKKDANLKKIIQAIELNQMETGSKKDKKAWKKEKELQQVSDDSDGLSTKEYKVKKPERGIETMFRLTSQNHLELSSMADNKANIMISINSIIVSLLVSILIRKFEEFPNLIIPTTVLVVVCLATIVFAVLATRPKVTTGRFSKEDIINRQSNLLFFGNFYNMSLEDYEWGIKEMMKDSDYLYSSMTRDIYFQGLVLGRKYRLLWTSYTIFMYGFVFAIICFGIAMFFFPVEG